MKKGIKVVGFVTVALVVGAVGAFVFAPARSAISYVRESMATDSAPMVVPPPKPEVTHLPTPSPLKAIYMTQCVAGTPSFRDSLVKFIEGSSELNAVVIDIKDFSGSIGFPSDDPALNGFAMKKCGAYDMKDFVQTLHDKGIYVIGRITVFQDPLYAAAHPELAVQKKGGGVWHDNKGLAFMDVGARPFWDYIVQLSKVSYEKYGFDELNYDYVRFPSDGPMDLAVYSHSLVPSAGSGKAKSKEQALEEFFRYLHAHVQGASSTIAVFPGQPGPVMSADLFGYVTVHTDDLGIGQILERALPYFDYIMPMVYPSHYNSGFAGLKNVNSDPHKVVYVSMAEAVRRTVATTTVNNSFVATPIASTTPQQYLKPSYPASKMRPWLQSFDYPVPYTPKMVEDQILANEKSGLDSYIFWDAANKYRSLREALAE